MAGGGFGFGAFGQFYFGEWKWARSTLYDLMPELYRLEDEEREYIFREFMDAIGLTFDEARHLIRDFGDLRDPSIVRTAYDQVINVRLGRQITEPGKLEQRGVDGKVQAGEFTSPTIQFEDRDLGKTITVSRSSVVGNNRTVTIISVTSRTSVVTEPVLSNDTGPLRWELRAAAVVGETSTFEVLGGDAGLIRPGYLLTDGLGKYNIESRIQYKLQKDNLGITEREGTSGYIDNLGRLVAPTAAFIPADIGKKVAIFNSVLQNNLRHFEIIDLDAVLVAATGTITTVGGAFLIDGETVTIGDGSTTAVFEFDSNASVSGGNVAVTFTSTDSAATVRNTLITAINGTALTITATAASPTQVSLLHDNPGIAGNVPISNTVADSNFVTFGMAGGSAAARAVFSRLKVPGRTVSVTIAGTDSNGDVNYQARITPPEDNLVTVQHVSTPSYLSVTTSGNSVVVSYGPTTAGSITNTADNGSGLLRITSASHGFTAAENGALIWIQGLATAGQNGLTAITYVDSSTLDCDDIAYLTSGESGTWDEGTADAIAAAVNSDTMAASRVYATVGGTGNSSVASSVVRALGYPDPLGGVDYSLQPGITGVRIKHTQSGLSTPLSVSVTDDDITVNLETDAYGVAASTALEVATAVNADSDASELVLAAEVGAGTGIAAASSLTEIPGATPYEDGTTLDWSVLPAARIELSGAPLSKGVVEQDGIDGQILSGYPLTFKSVTSNFTSEDVGKVLTIRGSGSNNDGVYEVLTAPSVDTVTLAGKLTAESSLNWNLRPPTVLNDPTQVQVFAPSLLALLAGDFGISIIEEEAEENQRRWVKSVSKWVDLKGSESGYVDLGKAGNFDASATQLYRITVARSNVIPSTDLFEIGDTTTGKSGTDGRLYSTGIDLRLVSATAAFSQADVGRQVRIQNAQNSGNNTIFTVDEIVSTTEVSFLDSDLLLATTPDVGVGGTSEAPTLIWNVVRIYTDLAPTHPRYDEINTDLMEEVVDGIPALGYMTVGTGAQLADEDYFVLDDGVNPAYSFEFDIDTSYPGVVSPPYTIISYTGTENEEAVRDLVVSAVNAASPLDIVAIPADYNKVLFQNRYGGIFGNVAIQENIVNATFTVTGMAGARGPTAPQDNFSVDKPSFETGFVSQVDGLTVTEITSLAGNKATVTIIVTSSGDITSTANSGGLIQCTSAAHGLSNNSWVSISNSSNETNLPSGVYQVTAVTTDTFELLGSTWVSGPETADWIINNTSANPIECVTGVGKWNLQLLSGTTVTYDFAVETIPTATSTDVYTFEIVTDQTFSSPLNSPARLVYNSPVTLLSNHSGSNRLILRLEDGPSVRLFDKRLLRIEDGQPVHTELFLIRQQYVDASLTLTASGTASP